MTPAYKARNVAQSIRDHGYDPKDAGTWDKYGLGANMAQQMLVLQALAGK
jgi:hypothetical protein